LGKYQKGKEEGHDQKLRLQVLAANETQAEPMAISEDAGASVIVRGAAALAWLSNLGNMRRIDCSATIMTEPEILS
jgi:hypothetical protein